MKVKQLLGARADKVPDTGKARKLLEVRQQIGAVKAENPTLDCDATTVERSAPEPPPPPPPSVTPDPAPAGPDPVQVRRARTLVIAGSVTTGGGGLLLGVMAGGLVLSRNAPNCQHVARHTGPHAASPRQRHVAVEGRPVQDLVRSGRTGNNLAIATAQAFGCGRPVEPEPWAAVRGRRSWCRAPTLPRLTP